MPSFGTARRAQARACLSRGPRLTVVFLTFSVRLRRGAGGGQGPAAVSCSCAFSGPVWYTNVLGMPFMLFFAFFVNNEHTKLPQAHFTVSSTGLLIVSCIIGVGISYSGWHCRSVVTATTYTVVGVMNKILTLVANILLWDQHSSPQGLAFLCLCIASGAMYRQAPLRAPPPPPLDSPRKELQAQI